MTIENFIRTVNLIWGDNMMRIEDGFVFAGDRGDRFVCTEGRLRSLLGSLSDLDCNRLADLIADVIHAMIV